VLFYTGAIAELPGFDNAAILAADSALREKLQQRVDAIASEPNQHRQAMLEGERRATLCKVCHGDDGNSEREGSPSLAGQDPVYIVDQFNRYADGRRADFWMGGLTASLSDEDKIKLAIYYSEQPMRPARGGEPSLIERGKRLYEAHCVECHGSDGRSREGYARLAGQRPEYTAKMLREFRSATGSRFSPVMYPRAYMLRSDDDITAVATYLAHMD
jgi:cytochrome c553